MLVKGYFTLVQLHAGSQGPWAMCAVMTVNKAKVLVTHDLLKSDVSC